MAQAPAAFMSYTHFDDQHDNKRLSRFRQKLADEVRFRTGEAFPIFQDTKDIGWGENWIERIEESLDAVTLLIPIITPSYFDSDACRAELERFLARERTLGRSDLVLPVYYVETPRLADARLRNSDALATEIATRQYIDCQELYIRPFGSAHVRKKIMEMAKQIGAALARLRITTSSSAGHALHPPQLGRPAAATSHRTAGPRLTDAAHEPWAPDARAAASTAHDAASRGWQGRSFDVRDLRSLKDRVFQERDEVYSEDDPPKTYLVTDLLTKGRRSDTARAVEIIGGRRGRQVVLKAPVVDTNTVTVQDLEEKIRTVLSQFDSELEAWKRLNDSPFLKQHIAEVITWGFVPLVLHGRPVRIPFIVQEYIEGQPLDKWCQHYASPAQGQASAGRGFTGISSASLWFKMARALMTVLARVHDERIVHGEIWPANIIVRNTTEFTPVLIDFGQAWVSDSVLERLGKDDQNDTLAKYYAPERLNVSENYWYSSADIYSMCGVLYFLATGLEPISPFVFLDHDGFELKRKTSMRKEIREILRERNQILYYENMGVLDVIMYGLRPKSTERAFNADQLIDLIDIYDIDLEILREQGDNNTASLDKFLEDFWQARDQNDQIMLRSLADALIVKRLVVNDIVHVYRQFRRALDHDGRLFTVPGGDRDRQVNYIVLSLRGLQAGDEILAQTTPLFWHRQNFGPDGRVMTMLKMAVRSGVTVRWVLVVEKERDWKDSELEIGWILEQLRAAMSEVVEVESWAPSRQMNGLADSATSSPGGMFFGVKSVDEDTRGEKIRLAKTFVLIRQHGLEGGVGGLAPSRTLIAPTYTSRTGAVASLRFWRDSTRAQEFEDEFIQALSVAVPLENIKQV